jgi:hypothetical protein
MTANAVCHVVLEFCMVHAFIVNVYNVPKSLERQKCVTAFKKLNVIIVLVRPQFILDFDQI